MNDLISIIIPIYKVEAYLRNCLESIRNQTYTNFEVLLINDGSPDNSEQICLEFEQKDTRFNYFYKENGGVSSARNLGLEKAVGKWVVFVDSDDTVEKNYLNDFVLNINDDKSLVLQDFIKKMDNELIFGFQGYENITLNLPNDLNILLNNYKLTQGYLWNKIFNKDLIINNKLRFNDNLNFCEDEIFYLKYIEFINEINIISKSNYIYNIRRESLSFTIPSFEEYLIYINEFQYFLVYLKNNISSSDYYRYVQKKINYNFNYIFNTIILKNKNLSNNILINQLIELRFIYDKYLYLIQANTLKERFKLYLFKKNFFRILIIKRNI
ncbi:MULTISPECIES: glycosyltransferase family 2 protein [unclassified Empedobacter]|uniref:glycosyltransferase family 2 protein n=1 Tax=unclassified Empedobacter TaxID=2643773 RepID=UPI00244CC642|nr:MULTISPECIES: glycosyltransferase family 2 protein [unclassified Empedobacter]MDH1603612.1 glycosyltransferase family 2 protein [Empedobacter sp. GD03739]